MDRVRILVGDRLKNGDKPVVIICAVGDGANVIGEFAIMFENFGQIRVESVQSSIFNSNKTALEQLKAAVLNQLESRFNSSTQSDSVLEENPRLGSGLVEQTNAYVHLVELCNVVNGRERLEFISENTSSNQLKVLIRTAVQDANES